MIAIMPIHDTEENGRFQYTKTAAKHLAENRGFRKVIFVLNGCSSETVVYINMLKEMYRKHITVISLSENIGTAQAINAGLTLREPGEHAIKIDNDTIINDYHWQDIITQILDNPNIGVACLKRKDLQDRPGHPDFPTTLGLIGGNGERWTAIEMCDFQMGTVMGMSGKLLDKVGNMWQPGIYGLDDYDMCLRSKLSGYTNCYIPGIDIDHLDTGGTPYTDWKVRQAGEGWEQMQARARFYEEGGSLWC